MRLATIRFWTWGRVREGRCWGRRCILFARWWGVELNPGLAAIARANTVAFAEHEAASLAPVRVVEGDVLEVEWPEGPVVAYMFHPFEEPLVRRFLAKVETEFAGRVGDFDLLYVNAEHGWGGGPA